MIWPNYDKPIENKLCICAPGFGLTKNAQFSLGIPIVGGILFEPNLSLSIPNFNFYILISKLPLSNIT